MKHFPFKIAVFGILLPPVFYIYSLQLLETLFQQQYQSDIKSSYIGDTMDLLNGSIRLQNVINHNIDSYIKELRMMQWGGQLSVTVRTQDGSIIYPAVEKNDPHSEFDTDQLSIAIENFQYLNQGLRLHVEFSIDHNTLISNIILSFYVIIAILIVQYFYRIGYRKIKADEKKAESEFMRIAEREKRASLALAELEEDRRSLTEQMIAVRKQLKIEKEKANKTENEMLAEMIALEDKINQNLALQEKQKEQIANLKSEIQDFENTKSAEARHKQKTSEIITKRFQTLYKNTIFSEKAVEGFVELNDDLKLKAEEVIHQLNQDDSLVLIKRKVFGKKNRQTVFEVIFGYKGRLYFNKTKEFGIKILAIGTKHTQNKDMAYLDRL